ncbi:MAG: hypothetical protein NVS4B12_28890 [Ktedonobacteraceae bacterium]
MIILLFALLLTFAIVITLAGLWLSPKKSAPSQRGVSYAGQMNVRRPVRRTRAVGENRRMNVRRSTMETERRAWTNILASLNISRLLAQQRKRRDTPWLGIVLILLTLLVFGVYFLRTVLPNPALIALLPDNANIATTGNGSNAPAPQVFTGASKALMRLSQVDPSQYNSPQEYDIWWPSACSAASMTEIINSYGHNYRVTDILKVEADIKEITPDVGLLEPHGLDKTFARFNFTTRWLNNPSVDDLIKTANSGTPVIINFPPSRWAGGHLLVALGGNKDYVYLADSSRLNMRAMDRKTFLKYWVGFAVVATPASQS